MSLTWKYSVRLLGFIVVVAFINIVNILNVYTVFSLFYILSQW